MALQVHRGRISYLSGLAPLPGHLVASPSPVIQGGSVWRFADADRIAHRIFLPSGLASRTCATGPAACSGGGATSCARELPWRSCRARGTPAGGGEHRKDPSGRSMSVGTLRGWRVGKVRGATHLEARLALRAAKLVDRHGHNLPRSLAPSLSRHDRRFRGRLTGVGCGRGVARMQPMLSALAGRRASGWVVGTYLSPRPTRDRRC